jgi:hypothetical protein
MVARRPDVHAGVGLAHCCDGVAADAGCDDDDDGEGGGPCWIRTSARSVMSRMLYR